MSKELWYDASALHKNEMSLVYDVVNRNYETVIFSVSNFGKAELSERTRKALKVASVEEAEKFPNADIYVVENLELAEQLLKQNKKVAVSVNVVDRESMEFAADITLNVDYVICTIKGVTNIPLELIIAKSQYDTTKILKIVDDVTDGVVSLGVMEVGADGIVLRSKSIEDISALSQEMMKKNMSKLELVPCEIVEIKHLEMGERACLDTTSMLTDREGMIIGCTSSGGLMICSEVHYLPYMNTRPFRVNAGAVCSYVWGPDNIVEYISDLRSGSRVVAVDLEGSTRVVNIGRVKTEVRPLILLRAKYGEVEVKSILQDDWHMRVFSPEGKVLNITDLKPGDKVLGHVCEPGRHVGVKISENIKEF